MWGFGVWVGGVRANVIPTNIWATLLALYRAEAWITPTLL